MRLRITAPAALAMLAAACTAAPQTVQVGPVNSQPWVSTQYPPASRDVSSPNVPFQTGNSLPRGAANAVQR